MTTGRSGQGEFEELFQRHRGIVFKVANTYCPESGEPEDLAQEICLQLWRAFPDYDRDRPFSTWAYRVALNVGISYARRARTRERRRVETVPSDAEPATQPDLYEPDERVAALYGFIRRLDDLNRALLMLYLEECSYGEIADVLGISETNVGTKLSRLRDRMRRELGPTNHDSTTEETDGDG